MSETGESKRLPPGWISASLASLGNWSGGGTPSKANPAFWEDGNIPWVSPKDMKTQRILGAQDQITEEAIQGSAANLLPAGSVLIVTRSGILRHTLPVAVADVSVAINQDLKALTPVDGLSPRYVALGLSRFGHEILDTCSKGGTTVQSVETPKLLRFGLPIAPSEEQSRIIEAIETQFTRLDAAVETLKRVQANLKRYRASVLKAAVEGRLVPTEAELSRHEGRDYEPATVLLERILKERRRRWEEAELAKMKAKGKEPKNDKWKEKYKEPVDLVTSELQELPEGWAYMTLEHFAASQPHSIKRGPFGSAIKKEYFVEKGFKVYEQQHAIHNDFKRGHYYVDRQKFDELRAFRVKRRDVIISCSGTVGKTAIVPDDAEEGIINQALLKVTPNEMAVRSEYFCAMFTNQVGEVRIRGSAMVNITGVRDLKAIRFAIPPAAEQRRILSYLDELNSGLDHTAEAVKRDMLLVNRLRQSILKWAFEGKLADQDPDDEPAPKLLEKIKKYRSTVADRRSRRIREASSTNGVS